LFGCNPALSRKTVNEGSAARSNLNYLTKPFEPAPFLAVIDEIMQESAAVRTT
jgi:hypothetical protein